MYQQTMMIPSYHCIAIAGLQLFFALLVVALIIAPNHTPTKLFLSTNGRSHRLVGAANLTWLIVGVVTTCIVYQPKNDPSDVTIGSSILGTGTCILLYDIILGILGTLATLTAAREFPHKRVINRPGESGTLSHVAMVTQGEMVEHSFYQMLNVWQALYLHTITWAAGSRNILRSTVLGRMVLLSIATVPWSLRRFFPVNSFSTNWTNNIQQDTKIDDKNRQYVQTGTTNNMNEKGRRSSTINIIYRIKKWQYVFYKHVILHGLNISMAFPKSKLAVYENDVRTPLPLTNEWRVFWLALNTSYVMEFFLQTLVKRGILSQGCMMILNGILMTASSLAAVGAVFGRVRLEAALISLLLNFVNRGHDVCNTLVTGCIVAYIFTT